MAAGVTAAGGEASVHPCDLSDTEELEAAVDDVLAHHVSVDVLVNNAGHSIWRSLSRSTERIGDFERTMQLN